MEYEPQEGVDYLVDLYAIVGVPADAPELEIKQKIRERLMQYHPDRLEGLAPQFQVAGQDMTHLLTRANAILLDPEKRQEYDQILTAWEGPVSDDGNPIIQIDRALQAEFHDKPPEEIEALFSEQAEKIATMLGYMPQRLELLQRLVDEAGNEVPDDLKAEYEAALLQRDQVLAVEEAERAKLLGIPAVTDQPYAATRNYGELVAAKIEETRQTRQEEAKRLALSNVTGRLALLAGDSECLHNNLPVTAAQLAALPKYFDEQAGKVQAIAQERERLLERRLGNLSLMYPLAEAQTTFTRNLALGLEGKQGVSWIRVELEENDTGVGSTLPEDIEILLNQGDFQQVIESGYNVATLQLIEQIDFQDLVRVAVAKYADGFHRTVLNQ